MIETNRRIAGIAAATAFGVGAFVMGNAAPAEALTNASVSLDCNPAYGVDVTSNQPSIDVNGDPLYDIFEASTGQSVVVRGGESGSIALGSSASLEDTTVTVTQTNQIYGDIYPDNSADVVLDCVAPPTTTTTEATTTTSEVTTSTSTTSTTEVPTSTSTSTTTSTTEVPTSTSTSSTTSTTEVPTSTSTSTTTPGTTSTTRPGSTTSTTEAGTSTTQQQNTTTTGAPQAPSGQAAPANAVPGNANFTG